MSKLATKWKALIGFSAIAAILGTGAFLSSGHVEAADHGDFADAPEDPTADITDLFAWMSDDANDSDDEGTLNLVLNVFPSAGSEATFSTGVQYVFHIGSRASYTDTAEEEFDIICQFYKEDRIECWAGDEYVEGDPSSEDGLESEGGEMKVFAGLRNDPFFFELEGFATAQSTVRGALATDPLPFDLDAGGCPDLDEDTAETLRDQLTQDDADAEPGTATDSFAGQNVLSLVVQIDKDLVNEGGDILAVWASSNEAVR